MMSNFAIIAVCLVIGYLFQITKLVKKESYQVINKWVIFVGLPAIALKYIPQIDWKLSYIFTAILPILVFGGSVLFFNLLNIWTGFSKRTKNTIIITAGLSNTSFVGFPLIISFFGEEQLKVGIVSDQVTFFTLSTLGVLFAASSKPLFQNSKEKYTFIIKRIFTFPPLIACFLALLLSDFLKNEEFEHFFGMLAATVSPMALFSIGMQLNFSKFQKELKAISFSVAYKLLIAPVIVILLAYFIDFKGVFYQVSVFEMAMPCLVASSMIIEKFGLNVKLANTIIGVSIVVGLLTAFLWHSVIITLL